MEEEKTAETENGDVEKTQLSEENERLKSELDTLKAENNILFAENEQLKARQKLPSFSARTNYREDKLAGVKAIFRKK